MVDYYVKKETIDDIKARATLIYDSACLLLYNYKDGKNEHLEVVYYDESSRALDILEIQAAELEDLIANHLED